MKKQNIWLLLSVAITLFIFARSFKPSSESTAESLFFVKLLANFLSKLLNTPSEALLEMSTVIVRKLAHIAEYCAQSICLCGFFSGFQGKIKSNIPRILFLGLLTACIDEAIQLTSEGRAGLISDVFIDFSGTVMGICVSVVFIWILSARAKKPNIV